MEIGDQIWLVPELRANRRSSRSTLKVPFRQVREFARKGVWDRGGLGFLVRNRQPVSYLLVNSQHTSMVPFGWGRPRPERSPCLSSLVNGAGAGKAPPVVDGSLRGNHQEASAVGQRLPLWSLWQSGVP